MIPTTSGPAKRATKIPAIIVIIFSMKSDPNWTINFCLRFEVILSNEVDLSTLNFDLPHYLIMDMYSFTLCSQV